MHEIVECLYLGGLVDASNQEELRKKKVVAIVNCCTPVELPRAVRLDWADYFNVDVEDRSDEPIESFFYDAANFIERHVMKKETVLVHCKTVLEACFPSFQNFDLQEAFFHVRTKRNIVCPNIGFMGQLCKLEVELSQRTTDSLLKEKVMDILPSTEANRMLLDEEDNYGKGDKEDGRKAFCPAPLGSDIDCSVLSSPSEISAPDNQSDASVLPSDSLSDALQSEMDPERHIGRVISAQSSSTVPLTDISLNCCPDTVSQSSMSSSRPPRSSHSISSNSSSHDLTSSGNQLVTHLFDHPALLHWSQTSYQSASPDIFRTSVAPESNHEVFVCRATSSRPRKESLNRSGDSNNSIVSGCSPRHTSPEFSSFQTPFTSFPYPCHATHQHILDLKSRQLRRQRASKFDDRIAINQHSSETKDENNHIDSKNGKILPQDFFTIRGEMPTEEQLSMCTYDNNGDDDVNSKQIRTAAAPLPLKMKRKGPSICMHKYIDWYLADVSYRVAVPDLDP